MTKTSILGVRSRTTFEMDDSSSQSHYNKLSETIDSDVRKALPHPNSSDWFDLFPNRRHRELARRIAETVDWSWTLNTPQNAAEYLQLYQLFLLCKLVAKDFQPSPETNRLRLSPSPGIDRLWHAHMLHPGKYLEMHTKLGLVDAEKFPRLLEHQPEAADDPYEMKTKRMASMMGMMFYICPTLYVRSHLQSTAAPSAYSVIMSRRTEETATTTNGLTVKVHHKSASTPYYFNIGLTTQLMKIVKYMSSLLAIPEGRLRLQYHGLKINPSTTAQSLGMKDGNEFYLFEEQTGC